MKYLLSFKLYEVKEWISEHSETGIITEKKNPLVKRVKSGIIYRGERFPGFNRPKKYSGPGVFTKRVLAKEGDKIRVLNFGHKDLIHKPKRKLKKTKSKMSKLTKRYWTSQKIF